MFALRSGGLLFLALVGSLAACETPAEAAAEGVGDPCIPEDESRVDFSGFGSSEVNVESRSFQCETRICLVNHFQGRVSCPFGQTSDALTAVAGTDRARCRVPGGDGSSPATSVGVPVMAWDVDRPAPDTVYCSCRCDGPDPDAQYCSCPSGYSCRPLVQDLGLGSSQLAGSYCVKRGTEYDAAMEGGATCSGAPDDAACPRPAGANP